ncbi:hybrid sensor histidine kinase/response regulator transcription factor [Pseudoalteromonas tunicata]|jgi:signal transduction histidine kinase/ligand-binding sensor domain-containing protein/DNA-binding response OmpR family regulator|uniref:histidine kinase n=1 Tax=Pseudoalteromonas tunicata D2 TaxID=87626 RepID=A4CEI6_9GAMM|nr:two-component regulator propeller domain-containing protein [Pseudoalteromonas tunicata]ATC92965.1 hypothetical protein PTUN_a0129 [Pseudoalteromonas tunicata]AXT32063.1 hybrid sensor histidine kinase/response regulator [Pseudoalteromonas tunicata]EAR26998.1 two-component system sensor histidine kinase/response [Pseudoalteromonas tunicata D2]
MPLLSSVFLFLTLLLFQLFPNNVFAAQQVYFDHFTVDQGISQNSVTCTIEDEQGFIWLGTQNGLNKIDGYDTKKYKANNNLGSIKGNWITACQRDGLGKLWFATASSGLNVYDPSTGLFSQFDTRSTQSKLSDNNLLSLLVDGNNLWIGTAQGGLNRLNIMTNQLDVYSHQSISVLDIRALYKDSEDVLWLGTAQGLFYLDLAANQLIAFHPKHDTTSFQQLAVWSIVEDNQNTLWVTGRGGLFKIDPTRTEITELTMPTKANNWGTSLVVANNDVSLGTYGSGVVMYSLKGLQNYTHNPLEANSLSNDYVLSLYQDSLHNTWIGTDGGGVNRFIPGRLLYNHQKHQAELADSLSHSFVRAITKDVDGNLWIATREGVNKRKLGQASFKRYLHNEEAHHSLPTNNVFALFASPQQELWLGTYGAGLAKYNPIKDNFIQYQYDSTRADSLISNRIYAITGADEQRLWLGSNAGLSLFNPDSNSSIHFKHDDTVSDSLSDNLVFSLLVDRQKQLWVGTRTGLNLLKPEASGFIHFTEGDKQLTANMVTALHQDAEGFIWIGTMHGLNRLNPLTHEIIQFTEQQGLIDENIFAIEEDDLGFIWISSNNGLMRLNKTSLKISHIKVEAGLQDRSFILGSSYQDNQGRLYFGGVNGFNEFNPAAVTTIAKPPESTISKLLLLNEEVEVQNNITTDSFNLTKQINELHKIELDHRYNLFSLEFTSAQSLQPQPLEYAYQLVGFDSDWVLTKEQKRFATYTNLSSGEYHFLLKSRFLEGAWGPQKQLKIIIHPAPWHSWWAYCLYALTMVSVVLYVIWLIYKRKIVEQEKRHSMKLIAAKDTLLATISHEFKTPLTLILGPLAGLIAKTDKAADREKLIAMARNAERLLALVNNVLQHKSIHNPDSAPDNIDLYALLHTQIEGFCVLAEQHQISLVLSNDSHANCVVSFQANAADQLVANLLHNAIKFTPAGGQVTVLLIKSDENCFLSITDTGIGIDADELQQIFTQGKRGRLTQELEGSGLGLSIVKDIVTRHGGEITVTSIPMQGSTFTVTLPLAAEQTSTFVTTLNNFQNDDLQKSAPERKYKILLVEDNSELRNYLQSILQPYYHCFIAANGEVGLAQVKAISPDLVISDVMMPIMSGFELLAQLRNELETCHIPVLILSAYHSPEMRMQGFDLLADEYLAKPFQEQELLARISSLLSIRDLIKRSNLRLSIDESQRHQGKKINGHFSERDTQFIQQLNSLLENKYCDVALSLEALANHLHLTERTLQNKTKALFDMPPMDYVREFRLEKAKIFLRQTDRSIGEIAELSGFNSQSYFARCFKAATGVSPKQYRAQQSENPLN